MVWSVYIVRCIDGTLYTGISTDVIRRVRQHNAGTGARYTRGRGPVVLLGSRAVGDRSTALRLEALLKRQPKERKLSMLMEDSDG